MLPYPVYRLMLIIKNFEKMKLQTYRDLIVWQKSMELVKVIYQLTAKLPTHEQYGLIDQMRRSAVSIPSNIAEGFDRNSTKEYVRFLSIANGSNSELMTQLEICKMIGYLEDISKELALCNDIGKMLNSMLRKLATD